DGSAVANATFHLTVSANTAPTISTIPNQTISRNGVAGGIGFTVSDAETPGSLTVTGSSSNQSLVPNSNITVTTSGGGRFVTVRPLTNAVGTATITLTVSDGQLNASSSFLLTVVKPNTPPTISAIPDQQVTGGTVIGPLSFIIGDEDTSADQLSLSKASSNQALVPGGNIVFGGAGANRTVTVTPAAGQTGAARIAVTVSDGSLSATREFLVTVGSSAARQLRVVSASGAVGGTVVVPVELAGPGGENAMGFSLSFDTQALAYVSAELGSGATGATLNINRSSQSIGSLGFAVALPGGGSLPAGTNQILLVTFQIGSGAGSTSTAIQFGDSPVTREVVDPAAASLPTGYTPGVITFNTTGYEADASPRPGGNGSVTIADWVQVGRYAAGLDQPASGSEFQRVDCAPRSSLGDGKITVADWVQAGRYAAGLDPLTLAGGPSAPIAPARFGGGSPVATAALNVRNLTLVSAPDGMEAAVVLNSTGDETGVAFSLNFDASRARFDGISYEGGKSGFTVQVNETGAAAGKVGIVLVTADGEPLARGQTQLLRVFFKRGGRSGGGVITFGDQPVAREVVDSLADPVQATWSLTTHGVK
ncbi:MAG TPA: cohesin domain-containing protein, partial [Verrucomicrobiae bacterium]|nr:cohesin domain-containing protein [Verrucomicrobiae bacterium]